MGRLLTGILLAATLAAAPSLQRLHAQPLPNDFLFKATTGGIGPWSSVESITIDSAGHARYVRYLAGGPPSLLADTSFTVTPANLEQLWAAIQNNSFGTLTDPPPDTSFEDGAFVTIRVKGNGAIHQVLVKNAPHPQIQSILSILNGIVPSSVQLKYIPPRGDAIVPQDPCFPSSVLRTYTQGPATLSLRKNKLGGITTPSRAGPDASVDAPHPGTVVAYSLDLEKAIKNRKVKLKSKGTFNGDAVSITGDNSSPSPSNTIDIKLYIDFWGPLATPANVLTIMSDIIEKWLGAKTSGGIPVKMTIVPRLSPDATAPPGTPGYHQIQLVDAGSRSYILGRGSDFNVNSGTGSGQWEVGGGKGTYAHEAGHLLGLPDQYDDYHRQADGTWTSASASSTFANDNDFAQYVVSKDPAQTVDNIINFLKTSDIYSIAKPGHENDLMGHHSKPLRQSDIDKIVLNPGMLISVRNGNVFLSRDRVAQNILITHSEDFFVPPGKKRTLNGLYGSCIDGSKDSPDPSTVFDLVPPLGVWGGYTAAAQLQTLAGYIDSTGEYCGGSFEAQDAIWRLTDNEPVLSGAAGLLLAVGIFPGDQPVQFPHLTSPEPADSNSLFLVPDELFPARIEPPFADGTVGVKSAFSGSVARPSLDGFTTSFTWKAAGPGGTPASLITAGDSVSFTPASPGVYDLRLQITVNDPETGQRNFLSQQKAYLLVPGASTETFEHANLDDRFPWKTYGDALWRISSARPLGGSYSAEGGGMSSNGTIRSSTLEIRVNMPKDSVITYFLRCATTWIGDRVTFSVDSIPVATLFGYSDWTFQSEELTAGMHTLQWTLMQTSGTPAKVWLDNVFFPANSTVSSVAEARAIPLTFELSQNYPNPFNPSTTIRYALPIRTHVTLAVFNTLGQEVAQLQNGEQEAGYHEERFDASRLSSGVYFYRLQAGAFVQTRRLVLVR